MTFARRRNRLTTHFSERIPVVKRRKSVHEFQWGISLSWCLRYEVTLQRMAACNKYNTAVRQTGFCFMVSNPCPETRNNEMCLMFSCRLATFVIILNTWHHFVTYQIMLIGRCAWIRERKSQLTQDVTCLLKLPTQFLNLLSVRNLQSVFYIGIPSKCFQNACTRRRRRRRRRNCLVIRVSGYRYRGLGFDSRRYQIFWVVVGLERGPLSLVRSIE